MMVAVVPVGKATSRRSETPLKALAQSVLAMPMPEDPLAECKPSKIVALYQAAGGREVRDGACWIR